jgi:Flp pilus assembly protein TadG
MARRAQRGATLSETAASLSLAIPILLTILFAAVEVCQALTIKESLAQAAREAARNLAIAYAEDPAVAGSRALQDALVFDNVRISSVVNDSRQFGDPVFDSKSDPPCVRVQVAYQSGKYGLPVFPAVDPLKIAGKLTLESRSVYRVE